MPLNTLEIILCILLFALFVASIFRKLRLSIILGYLLAGALVGPNGLALANDSYHVQSLAEFGIVFLMFTVGLEFSLPRLFALRHAVFVIGSLQVVLTIVITTIVGILLGMTTLSALTVGSIVAMSSTAIVVKQLNDQAELHSPHGLTAVGILLFQDLAVIPIIILIASLTTSGHHSLQSILLLALLKGLFAILLIFCMGRWLLRPLFLIISKTRTVELFTLTVLLVTLTSAWLTNLFGLSYALGAFLAGLMLAETEFRHQIEVEIRPFRDILLGLFFMSVGMLADVRTWYQTWQWIALLVSALVVGKMILITLISRLSGKNLSTAIRTGIVLAQGGEFGFAILTLALTHSILPSDFRQVVLAALLISIALSPILLRFNNYISTLLCPSKKIGIEEAPCPKKMSLMTKKLNQHIIICGYGRVGQHIARVLDKVKFPYVCLELDSELVRYASMAGENVIYGNPAHPGILYAVGLDEARAIVISFNDLRSTVAILNMVNESHPDLPKLVRCTDEFELKQLKSCGATHVIAELFEASLAFSDYLLRLIDIPSSTILQMMEEARSKDYDLLQRVFAGSHATTMADVTFLHKQLKPIILRAGAAALGKKVKALRLPETGVELIAVRRGRKKFFKLLQSNITLRQNDILVVYGLPSCIEEAEKKVWEGFGFI